MKITVTVDVHTIYDAMQYMIQHGASKQSVYANALGIDQGTFSKKYNNPTSPVYRLCDEIEKILLTSEHKTLLEYWADMCGFLLVRKTDGHLVKNGVTKVPNGETHLKP